MKIDNSRIIFSSGRTAYTHHGIIGINPELELYQGYDGDINWPIPEWWKTDHPEWINENTLTAEDMRELADFMIAIWTKFKSTLTQGE